jgi:hypothetical protein
MLCARAMPFYELFPRQGDQEPRCCRQRPGGSAATISQQKYSCGQGGGRDGARQTGPHRQAAVAIQPLEGPRDRR